MAADCTAPYSLDALQGLVVPPNRPAVLPRLERRIALVLQQWGGGGDRAVHLIGAPLGLEGT